MAPSNSRQKKGNPFLSVLIQPKDTFRFRYASEPGCHGVILGESGKKTYPTVKLENYNEGKPVLIKLTLSTIDQEEDHILELAGENCVNGTCVVELGKDNSAEFRGIKIFTKKKDEAISILKEREKEKRRWAIGSVSEEKLDEDVRRKYKSIDMSCVRLRFEALYKGRNTPLCDPVFSQPIKNIKSTNASNLRICRLSQAAGSCLGGEEIILLCDKVKKDDIEVHFFENDEDGNVIWEDQGTFTSADVHHQVAITFKTPRYNQEIMEPHQVSIELRRSDGSCSEPVSFTYKPNEEQMMPLKRKKPNPPKESYEIKTILQDNDQNLPFKDEPNPNLLQELFSTNQLNSLFSNTIGPGTDENASLLNNAFATQECPQDSYWSWNTFAGESDFNMLFPDLGDDVKMDAVCEKASRLHISSSDAVVEQTGEEKRIDAETFSPVIKDQLEENRKVDANMLVQKMWTIIENILIRGSSELLFKYAHLVMPVQDNQGNNLLHLAIQHQHKNLPLIKKLLEVSSPTDINRQNKLGQTPSHVATMRNECLVLKLLLANGASPFIQDNKGDSCLHIAAKNNFVAIAKELIRYAQSHDRFVQLNTLNYEGFSPLHLAVISNAKDCVGLFLESNFDPHVADSKSGRTSLHLAVEFEASLVPLLLKWPGIRVNTLDYRGKTAYDLALASDVREASNMLLKVEPSSDLENSSVDEGHSISSDVISDSENSNEDSFNWKKLCSLLDPPNDRWKNLAVCVGIDSDLLPVISQSESPAMKVLRLFRQQHGEKFLEALENVLVMYGYEDALAVLKSA